LAAAEWKEQVRGVAPPQFPCCYPHIFMQHRSEPKWMIIMRQSELEAQRSGDTLRRVTL
jgi:hypothetical protein